MPLPSGFVFYSGKSGFYNSERDDTLLIVSEEPLSAAGVFTTNRLEAAPVRIARKLLKENRFFSGVLINTGSANAATGKEGEADAYEILSFAQDNFSLNYPLLPCSTGVIGVRLHKERIVKALLEAERHYDLERAARTIMTTDTFPKYEEVQGSGYSICGISKGAGMISPSLATTLTVVLTDINISPLLLQKYLLEGVETSFNRISVDSEQSTNDAVILISSMKQIPEGFSKSEFRALLKEILYRLALKVLRDGEGATKIIRIYANGFSSNNDAERAAKRIAASPLVKTAVYGADPNWGRIYCALGNSGANLSEDRLKIWIGDYLVFDGGPCSYDEEQLKRYLRDSDSVEITVDARIGSGSYEFYTCDLTEKYIEINAHYRS
jgi:glutamate N-acetyltransferase/amino-acid N-acetyltransferase